MTEPLQYQTSESHRKSRSFFKRNTRKSAGELVKYEELALWREMFSLCVRLPCHYGLECLTMRSQQLASGKSTDNSVLLCVCVRVCVRVDGAVEAV